MSFRRTALSREYTTAPCSATSVYAPSSTLPTPLAPLLAIWETDGREGLPSASQGCQHRLTGGASDWL